MRICTKEKIFRGILLSFLLLASGGVEAAEPAAIQREPCKEVLVYPTREEGSIMHWLAISPLPYNAAYIGDSMSYDVFKHDGETELTIKPRAGDVARSKIWHKMSFTGTTEGPTMCNLFEVPGYGFNYGITVCCAYIYSPEEHPNAIFSGSSDDALKVILNGAKIWSNQIQRSPTYDSDQFAAPLKKGWNTLLCVVDQVIGGHLLTGRFLDDGKGVADLEISLDPPAADAKRYPALAYNSDAAGVIREADGLKADGKFTEAVSGYDRLLAKYPLSDVAPRAAYARALCFYSAAGEKSLDDPQNAIKALEFLQHSYGQDLLAEYGLLELGGIQERALHDIAAAEATFRGFEERYPLSSLAAKSVVELARLVAVEKKFEDSILTYRRAIKKYPKSDEVLVATVGIADVYAQAGEKDKAQKQYEAARAMAQDWHDNKYGVDVGKQAWLRGILDSLRAKTHSN